MRIKRKSITYDVGSKIIFEIKGYQDYAVVKGGNIINIKTRQILTKTVKGYTKGVWFGKKFITKDKLDDLLTKPLYFEVPF
jgi:hypothetical protein